MVSGKTQQNRELACSSCAVLGLELVALGPKVVKHLNTCLLGGALKLSRILYVLYYCRSVFYEEQSISKGTTSISTHLEMNRVAKLSPMEYLLQTSSEKSPKVKKMGRKKKNNYKESNNKI